MHKIKLLLLSPVLFIFTEILFAKEKLNYRVTSVSQIQNVKDYFEVIGNVFETNLQSLDLSIQESYGDEFVIFLMRDFLNLILNIIE